MSDNNDFEGLLQSEINGNILLQYTDRDISVSSISSGDSSGEEIELKQNDFTDSVQYIFLQKFTCPTRLINKNIDMNYIDYLKLIRVKHNTILFVNHQFLFFANIISVNHTKCMLSGVKDYLCFVNIDHTSLHNIISSCYIIFLSCELKFSIRIIYLVN